MTIPLKYNGLQHTVYKHGWKDAAKIVDKFFEEEQKVTHMYDELWEILKEQLGAEDRKGDKTR
jgi:hypothetical protein